MQHGELIVTIYGLYIMCGMVFISRVVWASLHVRSVTILESGRTKRGKR
jgi:hypothetical protein